jgi:hypothetical protein
MARKKSGISRCKQSITERWTQWRGQVWSLTWPTSLPSASMAAAQSSSRRGSEARKIPKKPPRCPKVGPPHNISSESLKSKSIDTLTYLANLNVRKVDGRGPGHGVLSEHRGREGRPLGHGQGVDVVKTGAVLGHRVAVEPLLELRHPPAHACADQPLVPALRRTGSGAAERPANPLLLGSPHSRTSGCIMEKALFPAHTRAVSCWCPPTRVGIRERTSAGRLMAGKASTRSKVAKCPVGETPAPISG